MIQLRGEMENIHTYFRNSISLPSSYKPKAIDKKNTEDQKLDMNKLGNGFDLSDHFTNVNSIPIVALRQDLTIEINIQSVTLQL